MFRQHHIYHELTLHLLKDHPERYAKTHRHWHKFKREVFEVNEDGKPVSLADWDNFKAITDMMFWIMGEVIIAGFQVRMGKLGYIHGRHCEANPNSLYINWKASMQYQKDNDLPCNYQNMVFYAVEDFVCMKWKKSRSVVKGLGSYVFAPSHDSRYNTDMRGRFSGANVADRLLKNRYPYFSLQDSYK